ncbi:MAG TPA: RsmE family RNA methyltransferase [Bacteroidales bacterium]|nr:RsmE family RNA methyltransferase [Bacteroidales bacterium]HRZ76506.1 RsmE family RNA methyltransferase [Bacteroidales bacterium]
MELHRFYCPDLVADPTGSRPPEAYLPPEEAQHALKVLRLKAGDTLQLLNGKGWVFGGRLDHPDLKRCRIVIEEAERGEDLPPPLHIAIAPPKNIARLEWFLEKATEIGIGRITPMLCERSERARLNSDRLERILVAAMKQSKRSWIPVLDKQTPFRDVIQESSSTGRYLAWLGPDSPPLASAHCPGTPALLLIGPEGDFSPEEMDQAALHGFASISLGRARLRTETAALYACAALNILNDHEKDL